MAHIYTLVLDCESLCLTGQEDQGEVVAMGTGTTCVTGDHLLDDGRTMFDTHAEVVARRALLKSANICIFLKYFFKAF